MRAIRVEAKSTKRPLVWVFYAANPMPWLGFKALFQLRPPRSLLGRLFRCLQHGLGTHSAGEAFAQCDCAVSWVIDGAFRVADDEAAFN